MPRKVTQKAPYLDTYTQSMCILRPMANKTIYVKDDALWERAKQLAGKEGLSGVIAEALAEFVQQKEAESRGFSLHEISLSRYPDAEETIKFWGKKILTQPLPGDDNHPASLADLYQTRAGKFLVVLKDAGTYEPFEYHAYDTPEELSTSGALRSIPDRDEFERAFGEALAYKFATWIA
jgi:hypothetical protein